MKLGSRQTMKVEAKIATAVDKFISGFSSSSFERALDSGKACEMRSLSDSSMIVGGRFEVVLEVVATTVRFLNTTRPIRRIRGCSSDFTTLGSFSPHISLCENRWKS